MSSWFQPDQTEAKLANNPNKTEVGGPVLLVVEEEDDSIPEVVVDLNQIQLMMSKIDTKAHLSQV
ncbi:hypothetical protein PtB15_4B48 [Puccinia triticina]|nr:hypothetical protein PtB15_4B48 [Puccinia triticina]